MTRDTAKGQYQRLAATLAAHFAAGDHISTADLPQLSDDDMFVVLHMDNDLLLDQVDPSIYADIFGLSHSTLAERTVALGEALRADALRSVREQLTRDVNDLLAMWGDDEERERQREDEERLVTETRAEMAGVA